MKHRSSILLSLFAIALVSCKGGNSLPSAISSQADASNARSVFGPSGNEKILHAFKGSPDGQAPYAGLSAGSPGEFFGTTNGGGATGPSGYQEGTVFEISSAGKERVLYSFKGGSDGAGNEAGVIVGKNGVLYGATDYGGDGTGCSSNGCGTVYQLTPNGKKYTEKILYAFKGGKDGALPLGDVMLGANGVLYGMTTAGGGSKTCAPPSGVAGCGTVFSLTLSGSKWTEKILHAFKGGKDGASPRDSLIADSSGTLYGTTEFGGGSSGCPTSPYGTATCGTVFSITPSGKETILYHFKAGANGDQPRAGLLAGKNGAFFGVTLNGGSSSVCGARGCGTAYELTRKGKGYTEHVLHSFGNGSQDGIFPVDPEGLAADSSGNIYGATSQSLSSQGIGTVFELSPSGSGYNESILHTFQVGTSDGELPYGSVVVENSKVYGTTFVGGGTCGTSTESCGTVYEVTP
ncbi:MAG TPA: choice-of-anchor tandem repeat GloVer-containing protein [Candidatus Cybelea sp.]